MSKFVTARWSWCAEAAAADRDRRGQAAAAGTTAAADAVGADSEPALSGSSGGTAAAWQQRP